MSEIGCQKKFPGSRPPTPDPALRLGLLCVKGLREEAGRAIVRARAARPFSSIDDLHLRVPELRKDELRKLAAVGALNFLGARTSCPPACEARSFNLKNNEDPFALRAQAGKMPALQSRRALGSASGNPISLDLRNLRAVDIIWRGES